MHARALPGVRCPCASLSDDMVQPRLTDEDIWELLYNCPEDGASKVTSKVIRLIVIMMSLMMVCHQAAACPIAPPPTTVPMNNAHRFSDHGGTNSEQLA